MDTYHVNENSFGMECPENWEEIADKLNRLIDDALADAGETPEYGEISPDGMEIASGILERYCAGEIDLEG